TAERYLHRGTLESDGFHFTTVETTGEIPSYFIGFSIYDPHECRLYLEDVDVSLLHILDVKTMIW
ncbi:hypothetical protein PFISCL1PPCAC_12110, partial [Pristionchus fissidentatus]